MGLPELWTHIDVAEFHSLTSGFVSRAYACVARAGTLPLDIHIRIPASHDEHRDCLVLDFITVMAKRARSLELSVPRITYRFDDAILDTFLSACGTGVFAKLVMIEGGTYSPHHVGGRGDPYEDPTTDHSYLSMGHKEFEKVLHPVRTLQLDGIYPFWDSLAYHGLVELRLTRMAQRRIQITRSALHYILSHSPRLRTFQFGVDLIDYSPDENRARPVRLDDLCNLNLECLSHMQLESLLSLIDPGETPLQLTISCHDGLFLSDHDDEIVEFLRNSNTTRFLIQGLKSYPAIDKLLALVPRLQALVLSRVNPRQDSGDMVPLPHHTEDLLPASFRLDSLYLINSRIPFRNVYYTLKNYLVRRLFLWGSPLPYRGSWIWDGAPSDESLAKLSTLCPDVKSYSLKDTHSLLGNWDPLD